MKFSIPQLINYLRDTDFKSEVYFKNFEFRKFNIPLIGILKF